MAKPLVPAALLALKSLDCHRECHSEQSEESQKKRGKQQRKNLLALTYIKTL